MPRPLCDRIDRAILDHLQRHGRTPNVDLAEAVRLSPSRRTKALEEDGVLAGYRADLDRERVGLGLTVFLSLKVEHSRTTSPVVEAALRAIDHMVACYVVSDDADFFVELAVPDLRTFEKVLTNQILANGPVRDARSTFCIRTVIGRGPLPLTSLARPACMTGWKMKQQAERRSGQLKRPLAEALSRTAM
ncbi:Lrp/AsnC family transcriptional regulator [Streptomyces cynarae]|uniref:Lrp/AsnC family transcriptional regulator n=1 Tax=Streptomyces cynarae TaxID=2981134 RepID=A0ABY6EBQ8_9ACTN|nr:Lrp/AsnC family transcriptional regulator [Streptomyces cynarae]UXY24136.1 Lrp/AsnC family transcriptional regulator [Streptomyces cynarae]